MQLLAPQLPCLLCLCPTSALPRPVKGACSSSWRNWKARCCLALQAERAAAPHLLLLSPQVPSLPAVSAPVSSSGIPVGTRPCLACATHLGKHLTRAPLHPESLCAASDQAQDPCVTVNVVLGWSWAPNRTRALTQQTLQGPKALLSSVSQKH